MVMFLGLWIALAVSIIVQIVVFYIFNDTGSFGGVVIPGNISFSITLALFAIWQRGLRILSIKTFLAVIGFVATCVALVIVATEVMTRSLSLGLWLTAPLGAIGDYPGGADVPLSGGLPAWAFSTLLPISAGLLLGQFFQRR